MSAHGENPWEKGEMCNGTANKQLHPQPMAPMAHQSPRGNRALVGASCGAKIFNFTGTQNKQNCQPIVVGFLSQCRACKFLQKKCNGGCPCIRGPLGHQGRPPLPWGEDFHFFSARTACPRATQKWAKCHFLLFLNHKKVCWNRRGLPNVKQQTCSTINPQH